MTINKFQGKTKEEAIEKAKAELGENAVVMNIKEIKPKGLFRALKRTTYEVTAAKEEKEPTNAVLRTKSVEGKMNSNIDYKADENITLTFNNIIRDKKEEVEKKSTNMEKKSVNADKESKLEERLDNLSNILEEKLGVNKTEEEQPAAVSNQKPQSNEELKFVRILYSTLLDNEVNEKYINQILDEIERFLRPGNNVDTILSNVYQKLILRFGQPNTISLSVKKPKVVFFIGPTGVGKTTTIAKIASKYKVEMNKKVAFITADTYRIAATEQLRVYANILDAPISIVYSKDEMNSAIEDYLDYDLVFVDTAGFSHRNEVQRQDMKELIAGVDPAYEKEVYLVLSATTKYDDLKDIVDIYNSIASYKLIFTKLDETTKFGNLLNVKIYADAELAYTTNGQNVPDDIEVFDSQKIVKKLLGGTK